MVSQHREGDQIRATCTVIQGEVMLTRSIAEDWYKDAMSQPVSKSSTWSKWPRTSIALLLMLAVLIAAGVGTAALSNSSWSVNPVLSGSMRPGFAVGGAVISERVPVSEMMVRDVIVFRRPDKPSEQMVHRIIKIAKGSSGQFLINTQGDANTVRVALGID